MFILCCSHRYFDSIRLDIWNLKKILFAVKKLKKVRRNLFLDDLRNERNNKNHENIKKYNKLLLKV